MAKKAATKKAKRAIVDLDTGGTVVKNEIDSPYNEAGELRCTCASDGRRTGPCPRHDA